jgi:predicted PhzF superfamily epimerase YddE/YHI9
VHLWRFPISSFTRSRRAPSRVVLQSFVCCNRRSRPTFFTQSQARALLEQLGVAGVIVTALGESEDFVLRSFSLEGPMLEETVSGSALSRLVPYWSARLSEPQLTATQLSQRGATLLGSEHDGRIKIAGPVTSFAHGRLYI